MYRNISHLPPIRFTMSTFCESHLIFPLEALVCRGYTLYLFCMDTVQATEVIALGQCDSTWNRSGVVTCLVSSASIAIGFLPTCMIYWSLCVEESCMEELNGLCNIWSNVT